MSNNILFVKCTDIREDTRGSWSKAPPIGLLYLAAALRSWGQHQYNLKVINIEVYQGGTAAFETTLRTFKPAIVALSAVTGEASNAIDISKRVKALLPDSHVILGGPHASMYPRVVQKPTIDFIIRGEGERSFTALADALISGQSGRDIPGVSWSDEQGDIQHNEPYSLIELDDLPMPAWDLLDFEEYKDSNHFAPFYFPGKYYGSVVTSRGCPYRCAFCHNIFGKETRFHSAQRVLEEIDILHNQYGVHEVLVVDDIFNLDYERAMDICDGLIERGSPVKLCFPNGLRGDLLDRPLIKKMAKAGCYHIMVSFETASPRLQDMLHKNLNIEKTKQNVAYMDEEGIIAGSYFMLGLPTENKFEMFRTIQLADIPQLDYPKFFVAVPQPGTEMQDIARKHGVFPEAYNFDEYIYTHDTINCSAASDDDFQRIFALANAVTERKLNDKKLRDKIRGSGLCYMPMDGNILPETRRDIGQSPMTSSPQFELDSLRGDSAITFPPLETIYNVLNGLKRRGAVRPGWLIESVDKEPGEIRLRLQGTGAVDLKLLPRSDDVPAYARSSNLNIVLGSSGRMPRQAQAAVLFLVALIQRADTKELSEAAWSAFREARKV